MNKIDTVTLEFLRHGPAHNQLLSPLTNYLGLCGQNGAESVHVPYEHRDFLEDQIELRYRGGKADESDEDTRRRQSILDKTAVEMADILQSVPGLISGLGKVQTGGETLTHLRIVLSADELALLPFELAKVPRGCAGSEGNWLALQAAAPVCITRQVRTVSTTDIYWPRKPRILFIYAAPGSQVPFEEHLQALYKAIMPWLHPFEKGNSKDLAEKAGKILTILPNATVEDVEKVCAETAFTHVHILAHGMQNEKLRGSPFGLALHSRLDEEEPDVVSGTRFAAVLGSQKTGKIPAVVTVASCDSGNVGSVIYTGASFAHDLHRAGIPFVVASQFPLSFSGSVLMAEVVYRQLLWGEDPRVMLVDLRRKLYALHTVETHDWASLVAYEALPADLHRQLENVRYIQSRAAIDAAMMQIDKVIAGGTEGIRDKDLQGLLREVDTAAAKLPTSGEYETECTGLRATTEKRKAQVLYKAAGNAKDEDKKEYMKQCLEALVKSMAKYKEACDENMMDTGAVVRKKQSLHWVLGQYLSLRAILGKGFYIKLWQAARLSAETDLNSANPMTQAFAHGTLAELYLLLLAYHEKWLPQQESDKGPKQISHQMAREKALEHAKELVYSNLPDPFPVYSTRCQLERYIQWWGKEDFIRFRDESKIFPQLDMPGIPGVLDLAAEIVDLLTKRLFGE